MKLENLPCNLCGTSAVKVLGFRDAACFRRSRNMETEVRVVKCKDCGLIYANPMPIFSKEDFRGNYSMEYYNSSEESDYDRAMRRYKDIIKYKDSGSILDIGCAKGYFLRVCSENGWDANGIDVSSEAASFAKENFGLDVFVGELKDTSLDSERFDVVFADQLLEHLPDPTSFLTEVNRILKKGGLLFIAVPNEDSLVHKVSNLYFKLLGKKWTANLSPLYPSYHVHGFSPKTLKRMLEKARFRVLELSVYSGSNSGMDMYHPILRLGRQAILWLSHIIGAGSALQVYATK